jgi:hypothetical protein
MLNWNKTPWVRYALPTLLLLTCSGISYGAWTKIPDIAEYTPDQIKQFRLLQEVPPKYMRYNVSPSELLKIPEFKQAYRKALQPIQHYELTPYVSKLDTVWSPDMTSSCQTPKGIVMIYDGLKPHWASDTIRIVYFPDSKETAIHINDEFVEHQTGYFGVLNQMTLGILNDYLCKAEEK